MHPDSKEADLYRMSLIETWMEAGGLSWDDVSPAMLRTLVAATEDILEKQRLAMLDPGEDEAA